jgi:hypothetical protein
MLQWLQVALLREARQPDPVTESASEDFLASASATLLPESWVLPALCQELTVLAQVSVSVRVLEHWERGPLGRQTVSRQVLSSLTLPFEASLQACLD